MSKKRTTYRKALLVGVNNYENSNINDLNGCINDVTNIRSILKSFYGFKNKEIKVLTDSMASQSTIKKKLNWLTDTAKPGDILVFHFSGHGSQIRDTDTEDEEVDELDEIICPYDMNWERQTYIKDDYFNELFSKLPNGVILEVFLDCCHAGTGLRRIASEVSIENFPLKNRYLAPPVGISMRSEGEEDELLKRTFSNNTQNKAVLWAASKDSQTSADAFINNSYNGAFTFYLCKAIRDAMGNIPRHELYKQVKQSLFHFRYQQVPQLECTSAIKNKKLFTL